MHNKTKLRIYKFLAAAVCTVAGVLIIISSLNENIIFFSTPSDINETVIVKGKALSSEIRLGGIVKQGSIKLEDNNNIFILTDGKAEITVYFKGTLPMLFREEQGIAQGMLKPDGAFIAKEILAKHDEKYIPRELADDLKEEGLLEGEMTWFFRVPNTFTIIL